MRRLWLSIVLVASLIVGGTMNAWAAKDCPYLKTAAVSVHDCCPGGGMKDQDKSDHKSKSGDCKLGQACRSAPATAAEPAPVVRPLLYAAQIAVRMGDDHQQPTPLFSFWRPPRAA